MFGRSKKSLVAKAPRRKIGHRLLCAEALEPRRMLAQITVTTRDDLPALNDGVMTLREAIEYVNGAFLLPASQGGLDAAHVSGEFGRIDPTQTDTIVFAPGLSGIANLTLGSELTITRPLTIEGDGRITVSARNNDLTPNTNQGDGTRVFSVFVPTIQPAVVLRGLTITGGDVFGSGGGIFSTSNLSLENVQVVGNASFGDAQGGGVYIQTSTTGDNPPPVFSASGSSFSSNVALGSSTGLGGGIATDAAVVLLSDVRISGNQVTGSGGGAWLGLSSGESRLDRVVVSDNVSTGTFAQSPNEGGGIFAFSGVSSSLEIENSAFIRNRAERPGLAGGSSRGGALAVALGVQNPVSLKQSSFFGNSATDFGGAIAAGANGGLANNASQPGSYLFDSITVVGNQAASGGGISFLTDMSSSAGDGRLLRSSIVAGNTNLSDAPNNIPSVVSALSSYNLLGPGGAGGLTSVLGNVLLPANDPQLEPLVETPGVIPYRAPAANSPARNAGNPGRFFEANVYDQRGASNPRVLDGRVDIGAIERGGPVVTSPVNSNRADIVLLVDHSGSASGDYKDFATEVPRLLDQQLRSLGYLDNRYAAIGFGDGMLPLSGRGFSYLFGGQHFADAETVSSALAERRPRGAGEDGWDAIEHAVEELEIRPNAKVHFVLLSDEGRVALNPTLTPADGPTSPALIEKVLRTRNATLTVTSNAQFLADPPANRVLGVKSGSLQSLPSIEYVDATSTIVAGIVDATTAGAGNETLGELIEAGAFEEYAKLAWSTGGSAWNSENAHAGGVLTAKFAERFAQEVAATIVSQAAYHPSRIVRSFDLGALAGSEGPAFMPPLTSAGVPRYTFSGSPVAYEQPVEAGNGSASVGTVSAFQTALEAGPTGELDVEIPLPNGVYDVELFFADDQTSQSRVFDVSVEGQIVLNDLDVAAQLARNIVQETLLTSDLPSSGTSFGVDYVLGASRGVVKAFRVTVSDGALSTTLTRADGSPLSPRLNGVRVRSVDAIWQVGDFSYNGVVDALDYSIWRDSFVSGVSVTPHTGADHDGDGLITPGDYSLWASEYGRVYVLPIADLNGDGRVDASDYSFWRDSTLTQNLAADANRNGAVDNEDYVIWKETYGSTSAAPTFLLGGNAANASLVDASAAPRVTNVTISGSQSTHAPYSFASVAGSGEQLRTVPVGGADTVSITFSEDVHVAAGDLRIAGSRTGNVPTLASGGFSYDPFTRTASWRLVGWTFGDQYVLVVGDGVTDLEGNALDGEWVNPSALAVTHAAISEFPSGDGVAGGNFTFVATLLPADANLDNRVDLIDWTILGENYGAQLAAVFSDADTNGDGAVDLIDLDAFGSQWGSDLSDAIRLPADIHGSDLDVDWDDILLFDFYYHNPSDPNALNGDFDGDNDVDLDDWALIFSQWGLGIETELTV